ncbi:MAG: plasmid pRiA4b ORF-3 family protein [Bacteroidia bacterium]|nr:plasmid pRiA4b ORF-3 family protein [Bacteroidia bacterium]
MAIYKFRVLLEDEDNVYRDIEVKPSHSVWEFHQAIKMAFTFLDEPEAELYLSDNNWHELDFIAKVPEGQVDMKANPVLDKAMAGYVNDPHQRFIYKLFTYRNFTFFVELVKILPDDPKASYPRCVKVMGEPPRPVKPSLEPPPLELDESEMPRRRGRPVAGGPILITGEDDMLEPDMADLEGDDIAGLIDDANALDGIDLEGLEGMEGMTEGGEEGSSGGEFGEDEFGGGFGEEDENQDMGDFDFDSFSGGGSEEY